MKVIYLFSYGCTHVCRCSHMAVIWLSTDAKKKTQNTSLKHFCLARFALSSWNPDQIRSGGVTLYDPVSTHVNCPSVFVLFVTGYRCVTLHSQCFWISCWQSYQCHLCSSFSLHRLCSFSCHMIFIFFFSFVSSTCCMKSTQNSPSLFLSSGVPPFSPFQHLC